MSEVSWRDQASEQAQADLDGLLGPCVDFALSCLAKRESFFPFGFAMGIDDQIQAVGVDPVEAGTVEEAITMLMTGFQENRDEYRAVGFATDIHLPDQDCDAICVTCEHREGTVLSAVLPYQRRRFGRPPVTGELIALEADRVIWSDL